MGNLLQHDCLAGFRCRHQQPPLTLADRRHQVDDPRRQCLRRAVLPLFLLKTHTLVRMQRRQVFKQNLVLGFLGCLIVDRLHFEQRKIALGILRRSDQAGQGVTRPQTESPDRAGRDVDVIGTCKVGTAGRAQKPETILEDFHHSFTLDFLSPLCLGLQNGKNLVLLAQPRDIVELE